MKPPPFLRFILASATLVALLPGCSHSPTAPKTAYRPALPANPDSVASYFQWCWRNRDPSAYQLLFTGDYQFVFDTADSADDFYRTTPWTRTDEVVFGDHLFRGGTPSQPPATSITLDYTQDPDVQADPRPGMNPAWHQMITLQTLLRVSLTDGIIEIRGPIDFYVTRGDSAHIPDDLAAAGAPRDSTRWWVDRWVDRSLQVTLAKVADHAGAVHTQPAKLGTWAYLKTTYR